MRPGQRRLRWLLYPIAFVLLAGCTTADSERASPPPPQTAAPTGPAPEPAASSEGFAFAGTDWRLVEILSMDGNVFKPQDASLYTLTFTDEGKVILRADCNRGAGTWTAQGPSQLQFGPIAATRMKCSDDSISDRYLAQFEWVRSYVTRDGHLFLATMADGAIIEFEPAP